MFTEDVYTRTAGTPIVIEEGHSHPRTRILSKEVYMGTKRLSLPAKLIHPEANILKQFLKTFIYAQGLLQLLKKFMRTRGRQ